MGWLTTESTVVARMYGFISNIFFALGLFWCRLCKLDAHSVNYIRGVGTICIMVFYLKQVQESISMPWVKFDWMLLRSVVSAISPIFSILAIQNIKISVFAIVARFQIVVVYLLGIKYMGNKFDWRILIAGAFCIFGAILVLAPSLIGLGDPNSKTLELEWTSKEIFGLAMTFFWVIFDSAQYLVSSKVMPMVTPAQATFHLNIWITIYSSIGVNFSELGMQFHWDELIIYAGFIIALFLAQLLMSETFRVEKNIGAIALINCTYLVSTMGLDVLFLGTKVSFINVVGSVMVAIGSLAAIFLKLRS